MSTDEHRIQFFTATILKWQPLFQKDISKRIVLDSLKYLVEVKRIVIYGFVIMPNHIHLLWRLLEHEKQKNVQRDFMKFTAQQLKFGLLENEPETLQKYYVGLKDRQYQFWQQKSLSKTMYSRKVFEQKLDYIHHNPLQQKWQLVEKPEDYFYSSARFYLLNIDDWGFIRHYMEDI